MTPKIARFLDAHQPATPCLVLDIDRVEENFRALRRALPLATIYYAVKANPARPVLERLTSLGSSFDAASIEEIEQCLAAGAAPAAISFGNTIKKVSAIARAHALGRRPVSPSIRRRSWTSSRGHAPGSRVYCRLMVENAGADWPLSRKFGTTVAEARRLMPLAAELGLRSLGPVLPRRQPADRHRSPMRPRSARWPCCSPICPRRGVNLRMLNLGRRLPDALSRRRAAGRRISPMRSWTR